jgi:hypothetical protein
VSAIEAKENEVGICLIQVRHLVFCFHTLLRQPPGIYVALGEAYGAASTLRD